MGLFDFAADIGKKVFGVDDADAAEKIRQDIETNNPGINNLEVEMQEDTVCVLRGTCESVEAKEKAILMAGNMKGVSAVVAARLKVPEATAQVVEKVTEEEQDSVTFSVDKIMLIEKHMCHSRPRQASRSWQAA